MMNKSFGEAAPTWHLASNGLFHHSRLVEYSANEDSLIEFDGATYDTASSNIPLLWILRHKPEEWGLGPKQDEWMDDLHIDTPTLPPSWRVNR